MSPERQHPRLFRGAALIAAVVTMLVASCTGGDHEDPVPPDPDPNDTSQGGAGISVGPTGAYQRDVAIEVPPFHGLAPSLALRYDSSVGGGSLGVGWRLSGLSEIRRVSDGFGAPKYDASDVFRLDDMELISCQAVVESPSCAHPPPQSSGSPTPATFATRTETFQRIAFQPDAQGGQWTVWRKDGTQLEYHSGARTTSGPYTWEIAGVRDTFGNAVQYEYELGTAGPGLSRERVPRAIKYNGNEVRLYYESRPDRTTYANGESALNAIPSGLVERGQRLKTVAVTVDGALARAYTLRYQVRSSASGQSLLTEVKQYGTDAQLTAGGDVVGGSALPPTTFQYGPSAMADGPWVRGSFPVSPQETSPTTPPSIFAGRVLSNGGVGSGLGPVSIGDFDGDGRTDWNQLGWTRNGSTVSFVTALAGPPSSGGQSQASEVPFTLDEEWAAPSRGQSPIKIYSKAADLNGDRRSDLVIGIGYSHDLVAERLAVVPALSRGDGTFALQPAVRTPVHHNAGEGLADCQAGDLNGDGRADLACTYKPDYFTSPRADEEPLYQTRLWVALSQPGGTLNTSEETLPFNGWNLAISPLAIADSDRDGRDDLMFLDVNPEDVDKRRTGDSSSPLRYDLVVGRSTGGTANSFTYSRVHTTWEHLRNAAWPRLSAADINADDHPDFLAFVQDAGEPSRTVGLLSARTTPEGALILGNQPFATQLSDVESIFSVGDANGDGRDDVLVASRNDPGSGYRCDSSIPYPHATLTTLVSSGDGTFTVPGAWNGTWNDCRRSVQVADRWNSDLWSQELYAADTNGDRRADFLLASNATAQGGGVVLSDLVSPDAGLDTQNWSPADVTGDGRQDMLHIRVDGAHTFIETVFIDETGQHQYSRHHIPPGPASAVGGHAVLADWKVLDVNGDGRVDLVYMDCIGAPSSGMCLMEAQAFLSTGQGWRERRPQRFTWPASTPEAMAGDVNGDGLDDLVQVSASSTIGGDVVIHTLLGVGDGGDTGVGTFDLKVLDSPFPPATLVGVGDGSLGWRLADLNGDGRTDLVDIRVEPSVLTIVTAFARLEGKWSLAIHKAKADQSTGWTDAGKAINHADSRTWRPIDANGDGKTDFVHIARTGSGLRIHTLLTTGVGQFVSRYADVPLNTNALETMGDRAHWMTGDVNGDGRTDLVHQNVDESELRIDTLFATGIDQWTHDPVTLTKYPSVGIRDSQAWSLTDRDGDGRSDLVRVDTISVEKYPNLVVSFVRANRAVDLIQSVTSSVGATTSVTYRSSAQYSPSQPAQGCGFPLGLTRQVVAEVAVDAGRGSLAGVVGAQPTTRYGYGCPHWSRRHRAFLGYAEVMATGLASANRPAWRYLQRFLATDQCLIQPQLSAWLDDQGGYRGPLESYAYNSPGTPAFDCTLRASQRRVYGFNSAKLTSRTEYSYDEFGNVRTVVNTGDDSVTGDERSLSIGHNPAPDPWLVGLPSGWQLREAADSSGAILRSTGLCYDADTSLTCLGAPTKGKVTQRHDMNRQGLATLAITRYFYDAFGNLAGIRNPNDHGEALFFEKNHHMYPESMLNALSQQADYSWDPVLDRQTDVTDANHAHTHFDYDVFGRMILARQEPSGSTTTWQYLDFGDPSKQRIRQWTDDGTTDGLWTESRFDGLGRVYDVSREGANANSPLTARFDYADASDNMHRQSTWSAGEPTYETYEYDVIGRLAKLSHADDSSVLYHYDTEPSKEGDVNQASGTTLEITDERGHEKTLFFDAYDRLVKVTALEATTGQFTFAEYRYNAADEMTESKDSNGNTSVYHYDNRGNLVRFEDPDLGTHSFTYDLIGSAKSHTDARNRTIHWTYDELERPQTKTYPDGREITWNYDEPGHGASKGRLTSVHDLSGGADCPGGETESLSYDSQGQVSSQTKCIEGRSLTTQFSHDTLARNKTVTYPDGEQVGYTYNSAGDLDSMPGFVDSITYDDGGRPQVVAYENGATAHYTYDPKRQWLTSASLSTANGQLYDSSYDYESNGLVKSSSSATNQMNLTYSHDDLDRLISTAGDISEEYRYDPAGNMQFSSSAGYYAYPGQGPQGCTSPTGPKACPAPHAPTSVGLVNHRYDANGNLSMTVGPTPNDQMSIDWTDDQQPSAISIGEGATRFAYDHNGVMVSRESPTEYRRYFNPYVEYSQARGMIKNYYVGPQLIARNFGSGKQFLQFDNAGSVRLISDDNANVVDRVDYTSFGEIRNGGTTAASNLWFGGGRTDTDNSLIDMGARQYDPKSAHFLSPDTMIPDRANTQALNRYSYAYNSPRSYIDPSGHEPISITSAYEPTPDFTISFTLSSFDATTPGQICSACHGGSGIYATPFAIPRPQPPQTTLTLQDLIDIGVTPQDLVHDTMTVGYLEKTGLLRYAMPEAFPQSGDGYDVGVDMFGKFAQLAQLQANGLAAYDVALNLGSLSTIRGAPRPAGPGAEPPEDVVYRVIRPDENPAIGLVAKDPVAAYSVEGHLINGSKAGWRSQYISTTRDLAVAQKWAAKTGNRIVGIDLNLVGRPVFDLSSLPGRVNYLRGNTAWNFARSSSEVLIEGSVPPRAIFSPLH